MKCTIVFTTNFLPSAKRQYTAFLTVFPKRARFFTFESPAVQTDLTPPFVFTTIYSAIAVEKSVMSAFPNLKESKNASKRKTVFQLQVTVLYSADFVPTVF